MLYQGYLISVGKYKLEYKGFGKNVCGERYQRAIWRLLLLKISANIFFFTGKYIQPGNLDQETLAKGKLYRGMP